eukprot:CAMPEP_0196658886 /NCGR_PEP_ID=MMETSP1086-20130531/32132_1 /TAXON_ID=77921 /ORGANISM="Cyanoptyche  gloeocystis , Strain SAG4.97" /LENGTH=140 /DNA_ID=CAMNT_0041992665 /DNA_START=96 /DNA_END=515 /DNA_ORIENTATION=-
MGATTSVAGYGHPAVRISGNTGGLPGACASVAFSIGSSGSHDNSSQRCTIVRHTGPSSSSQTSTYTSCSYTTSTRSGGLGTSVVETKSEYRDSAGNVKSEHIRQIGNRSQVTRLQMHNGRTEETVTTTGLAEGEDFEGLW